MAARKHAEDTKVPVARSRAQIDDLLRQWECDGVRWTDFFTDGTAVLEFQWQPDGCPSPMLARFHVMAPEGTGNPEREWRRIHRVLRTLLVGQFNAVDSGLISLEEAVLPWTVNPATDRTVAQDLLPRLRELASGSLATLLPERADG